MFPTNSLRGGGGAWEGAGRACRAAQWDMPTAAGAPPTSAQCRLPAGSPSSQLSSACHAGSRHLLDGIRGTAPGRRLRPILRRGLTGLRGSKAGVGQCLGPALGHHAHSCPLVMRVAWAPTRTVCPDHAGQRLQRRGGEPHHASGIALSRNRFHLDYLPLAFPTAGDGHRGCDDIQHASFTGSDRPLRSAQRSSAGGRAQVSTERAGQWPWSLELQH